MREKSYTIPYWSYLWFFRYSRWNKFHSFTLLLNFKKTEIDIRSYKKSKLSKKENWLTFSCQILFCHIVILCCEPSLYFAFHFLFFPLYFPYTNSFFLLLRSQKKEKSKTWVVQHYWQRWRWYLLNWYIENTKKETYSKNTIKNWHVLLKRWLTLFRK